MTPIMLNRLISWDQVGQHLTGWFKSTSSCHYQHHYHNHYQYYRHFHRNHHQLRHNYSNDDDDSSENVAKKKKFAFDSIKINRVYLDPLNVLNAGDFSWS